MSSGTPFATEHARQALFVADSAGRLLELESRGVYGDGPYSASGAFDAGYPSQESAAFKLGTISANHTGVTDDRLVDHMIVGVDYPLPLWVHGCLVQNDTTGDIAMVQNRESAMVLSLVDIGDGSDIFQADSGEPFTIYTAGAVPIGGSVYSYIVDAAAAWTPEYGKGTSFNYLGLRGLFCQVEGRVTGGIEQKRILSNESNKLWFEGAWTVTPVAGDSYWIAGIYWEMATGYIYPQSGHSLSVRALRVTEVSGSGAPFWFDQYGSGWDQVKDAKVLRLNVTKRISNNPFVQLGGQRNQFAQVVLRGVVQDDQIVFRRIEMAFDEYGR